MSKVIDNIEDIASIDSKVVKVTSTDNAIVRFDGTSGQVQNSSVIIDDSGNVGVGTSSPSSLLDIKAQGADARTIRSRGRSSDNVSYIQFTDNGATTEYATITSGNTYLRFDVSGSQRMIIDSSGNVGIGVTPSTWTNSRSGVVEIGNDTIGSFAFSSPISELYTNAYINNGVSKYKKNGRAGAFNFGLGTEGFSWWIAPSGTAGNAITWTTAMTLDASGNLLVPTAYTATTASASNAVIGSNGQIFRSTSSIKYKTNVEDIEKEYIDKFFNNARPIYYKSLSNNDNPNWGYWGFIAEEVAEFDKRLVHWRQPTKEIEVEKTRTIDAILDEENNVIEEEKTETYIETEIVPDLDKPLEAEGVMYERIVVLLTSKVQEQQEIINDLKARLEILESK